MEQNKHYGERACVEMAGIGFLPFFFKVSCTTPLHQIIGLMIPVMLFSISFSSAAFPDANRTSWGYKGCTEAKDQYAGMFLRYFTG